GGSLGDERARDTARQPPLSVDARRRRGAAADRGRLHHGRARARGRPPPGRGPADDGRLSPRQSPRDVVPVRVAIVGCGAVGSLFAANLAQLDDVEVWAFDLARDHVDAINRDGLRLSGAGELVGRVHATADAGALPACEFGIVAPKAMHADSALAAP